MSRRVFVLGLVLGLAAIAVIARASTNLAPIAQYPNAASGTTGPTGAITVPVDGDQVNAAAFWGGSNVGLAGLLNGETYLCQLALGPGSCPPTALPPAIAAPLSDAGYDFGAGSGVERVRLQPLGSLSQYHPNQTGDLALVGGYGLYEWFTPRGDAADGIYIINDDQAADAPNAGQWVNVITNLRGSIPGFNIGPQNGIAALNDAGQVYINELPLTNTSDTALAGTKDAGSGNAWVPYSELPVTQTGGSGQGNLLAETESNGLLAGTFGAYASVNVPSAGELVAVTHASPTIDPSFGFVTEGSVTSAGGLVAVASGSPPYYISTSFTKQPIVQVYGTINITNSSTIGWSQGSNSLVSASLTEPSWTTAPVAAGQTGSSVGISKLKLSLPVQSQLANANELIVNAYVSSVALSTIVSNSAYALGVVVVDKVVTGTACYVELGLVGWYIPTGSIVLQSFPMDWSLLGGSYGYDYSINVDVSVSFHS